MPTRFTFFAAALTVGAAFAPPDAVAADREPDAPEKVAFFESRVRPLLLAKCGECHGDKKAKGGLRLDSRAGWVTGGESGPAIVPGKPDESLLIKAVRYLDKDLQMPPKKALDAKEVEILVDWVRQGAVDPRTGAAAAASTAEWDATFQKRLDWWSLKPLRPVEVPKAFAGPWGRDPLDRFIKTGLDGAGLRPAARAEPDVLLRRLSFVLTGLPPTPALRDRFLELLRTDEATAYEKMVDEMLASPHFGERFARHWMDVVRYTDTYGYEWDNPAKGSHEYRDYLIRAFNGDLPYDQFVREQLAGDLLPKPRINAALGVNESAIGPMFFSMGEHRHGSSLVFNGVHQEMINNKIDALSKTFLALTVACARCHDHKLEAVSQRDYYALAAVLMTPRWTSRVIDAPGKNDDAIRQLKALRDELRAETAAVWRRAVEKPDDWAAAGWLKRVRPKDAKAPALEELDYPLVRLASPGRRGRDLDGAGHRVARRAGRAREAQPGVHAPRGLREAGRPGGVGDRGRRVRLRVRGRRHAAGLAGGGRRLRPPAAARLPHARPVVEVAGRAAHAARHADAGAVRQPPTRGRAVRRLPRNARERLPGRGGDVSRPGEAAVATRSPTSRW